jgi:hypothetical protein
MKGKLRGYYRGLTAVVTKRSGKAPVKRLSSQQRKDGMIPDQGAVQSL